MIFIGVFFFYLFIILSNTKFIWYQKRIIIRRWEFRTVYKNTFSVVTENGTYKNIRWWYALDKTLKWSIVAKTKDKNKQRAMMSNVGMHTRRSVKSRKNDEDCTSVRSKSQKKKRRRRDESNFLYNYHGKASMFYKYSFSIIYGVNTCALMSGRQRIFIGFLVFLILFDTRCISKHGRKIYF